MNTDEHRFRYTKSEIPPPVLPPNETRSFTQDDYSRLVSKYLANFFIAHRP